MLTHVHHYDPVILEEEADEELPPSEILDQEEAETTQTENVDGESSTVEQIVATSEIQHERSQCDHHYKLKKMKFCTHFEKMKDLFVPNECRVQVYYLIKFRFWRYIIFKVDEIDKNSISIEKCGLREDDIDQIREVLNPTSPRYIILDHEFTESGHGVTRKQDKIIFISYIPDDTNEI